MYNSTGKCRKSKNVISSGERTKVRPNTGMGVAAEGRMRFGGDTLGKCNICSKGFVKRRKQRGRAHCVTSATVQVRLSREDPEYSV
jgi:hypothetical protein